MKVLLLGGTGAIGKWLADDLAGIGCDVYVTSRSSHKNQGKVNYLQVNAMDMVELKPVLEQGWDAIIDFMVYSTAMFGERCSILQYNTKQYVFLSSARVYADSSNPIKENSPRLLEASKDSDYLKTDEYALKKAKQENILFESKNNNYTIIRPYITYDSYRLQLGVLEKEYWLQRALQGKSIVFSQDIAEHYTTLTFGKDVACAICHLIGNPNALGQAFHITQGEAIRWKDILDIYINTIGQNTGKRPNVVMIKEALNLNKGVAKYQVLYDRIYDRKFDNSKILSITPNLQFTTVEEGLSFCLSEFLKAPKFRCVPDATDYAMRDKLSKEFTQLSFFNSTLERMKYLVTRYTPFYELKNRLNNK